MSSNDNNQPIEQGMNGAAKLGKSSAKAAAKAGKNVLKKTIGVATKRLLIKFAVIFGGILLLIIFAVAGTSGPAMTKTEYLTALNQSDLNSPESDEEMKESIYEKDTTRDDALELLNVIQGRKRGQRSKAISEMRAIAVEQGCDPDATEEYMIDETSSEYSLSIGAASIQSTETMSKIWKFFKANGFSDEATSGIMGNIKRESNFKPEVKNNIGAMGLCQWFGNRGTRLKAFANSRRDKWSSLDVQLDYILYEFNTLYKSFNAPEFKSSTDISYTTDLFLEKYEIAEIKGSKGYNKELRIRTKYANEIYKQYKGIDAEGIGTVENPADEVTFSDFDILAAYSLSVGNSQMVLKDGTTVNSESDGETIDKGTYTDIEGNKIPLYWFGKKSGLPNYKKDLKKKLESAKDEGFNFYKINYSLDENGNYDIGTYKNAEGEEIKYLKTTISDTDITDGENPLAKTAFGVDPEKEYQNSGNKTKTVIKGISKGTYEVLFEGEDLSDQNVIHGNGTFANPLGSASYTITGEFDEGRDWDPYGKTHKGLDMAAPLGTPIYAAEDGVVEVAGVYGGYGYTVIINHGSDVKTIYGHQNYMGHNGIVVRKGQKVIKGQMIGHVGNTGFSTGPHLHFEVQVGGKAKNPHKYLGDNQT